MAKRRIRSVPLAKHNAVVKQNTDLEAAVENLKSQIETLTKTVDLLTRQRNDTFAEQSNKVIMAKINKS